MTATKPTTEPWDEYDSAADWCAARRVAGGRGDRLPENLSAACAKLIYDDPEAFELRVRDSTYARSMEGGAS